MLGLGLGINKHKQSGGIIPVLEDYGASAAAYSLRYLYPTVYTGDVVLVRRGGNNAEQGFTPEEIEDGTLVAFCNGGNGYGYVKTWYNQTTTADLSNTLTTEQPIIVQSGVLVTLNGKPAIKFTSHGLFNQENIGTFTDLDVFGVFQYDATGRANDPAWMVSDGGLSGSDSWAMVRQLSGTHSAYINHPTDPAASRANGTVAVEQIIAYYHFKANSVLGLAVNGSYLSSSIAVSNVSWTGNMAVGSGYIGTTRVLGAVITVQEFVFFTTDKLSIRTDVENNINTYYSIY